MREREFRYRFHVHFLVLNSYRLRFVDVIEESGLWVLITRHLVKLKSQTLFYLKDSFYVQFVLKNCDSWMLRLQISACWSVERERESLRLVEAIVDDNKSYDLVTLLSLLSALSCSELSYIQRPEFL